MGKVKLKPNGAAAAALLSAMVGLLTLGIAHLGAEASGPFKDAVFSVGKAWIPNAQGIGPYSGKETFMLVGWLLSWVILHAGLRKRNVNLKVAAAVFVVGLVLATLFVYTPFIHFILGVE